MKEQQIQFEFDSLTIKKILKGMIIAIFPTLALLGYNIVTWIDGNVEFGGVAAILASYILPTIANILKEYSTGK